MIISLEQSCNLIPMILQKPKETCMQECYVEAYEGKPCLVAQPGQEGFQRFAKIKMSARNLFLVVTEPQQEKTPYSLVCVERLHILGHHTFLFRRASK